MSEKAYRPDGTEVHVGDQLISFRGEVGYFVSASQSRVSGKVTTADTRKRALQGRSYGLSEAYPRVWGLHEPIGTRPGDDVETFFNGR